MSKIIDKDTVLTESDMAELKQIIAVTDAALAELRNPPTMFDCMKLMHASPQMPTCHWREDSEGNWHMDCGTIYIINHGTPKENGMNFCHKCGKKLVQMPYTEEPEQ